MLVYYVLKRHCVIKLRKGTVYCFILRGIFRKWEGAVGTVWSGLRIGTGGGHL
jgi:hypothetical protein